MKVKKVLIRFENCEEQSKLDQEEKQNINIKTTDYYSAKFKTLSYRVFNWKKRDYPKFFSRLLERSKFKQIIITWHFNSKLYNNFKISFFAQFELVINTVYIWCSLFVVTYTGKRTYIYQIIFLYISMVVTFCSPTEGHFK